MKAIIYFGDDPAMQEALKRTAMIEKDLASIDGLFKKVDSVNNKAEEAIIKELFLQAKKIDREKNLGLADEQLMTKARYCYELWPYINLN